MRFGTQARAGLAAHVTAVRPEAAARLDQITRGMMARGIDAASAQTASLKALWGGVYAQSMMLAFRKDFFLLGIVFLCVLPLLYFLKVSRTAQNSAVHLE